MLLHSYLITKKYGASDAEVDALNEKYTQRLLVIYTATPYCQLYNFRERSEEVNASRLNDRFFDNYGDSDVIS